MNSRMAFLSVMPTILGFIPSEPVAVSQPKQTQAVSSTPTITVLTPSEQVLAVQSKFVQPDPPILKSAKTRENQKKMDNVELSP
jgi:hypothetical protein